MPLVKQRPSGAKQVWWGPSILKRNKLRIKIGENKKSIDKSYLPVHTTLASTFPDYILNWLCFTYLQANIPTNIQNIWILKDIDQKN